MDVKTYTVVIGTIPSKKYSAGWLVGSIPAHLIACELNSKVFWFCPVQFGRGVKHSDREIFKEMIHEILNRLMNVGEPYKGLKLDEYFKRFFKRRRPQ